MAHGPSSTDHLDDQHDDQHDRDRHDRDQHDRDSDPDADLRRPERPAAAPIRAPEAVLLLAVPAAVAVALAGLTWTGAFETRLIDPGELVTRGLPVARVVHDTAASLTIGLLTAATFLLPGQRIAPGIVSYSQNRALRWATWSSAVWVASALAVLVFTAANAIGQPLDAPGFRTQLLFYATQLELGQTLVASTACAAAVLLLTLFSRRLGWVAAATAIAVLALLPLSLSGHAAGADEHANAVNSLAVHLIGVTAWAGGLVAVILLRRAVGGEIGVVVARYSALAGWAFGAVAFSGLVNASLRIEGLEDLGTPYGQLLIVKAVALLALGGAGAWHRLRLIPRLRADPADRRAFVAIAVGEVVVMALTIGVSVALSNSAPPVSQDPVSGDARRSLLGFHYPPEVTPERMLDQWHLDAVWLGIAVVGAALYVRAVLRLRRRGDAWPIGRTLAWVAGCAALAYTTSGGPGVYGQVHFSTHMIQHMLLMMVVPPLLVLGGPVLLALRVLPVRRDGGRGLREWILAVVHSRYLAVLSKAPVAAVLFAGSLVAFYYTGWFEWAMFSHQGHVLMTLHFLATGYLFFWVLIGVDPGPNRPGHVLRLLVMLATLAFHAFFGLPIMSQTTVLAAPWWTALGYTDTEALLADQGVGGGIAWSAGEIPMVLIALVVVAQWVRSEERTAKRYDRRADRDGEAELAAYNERLDRLDRRGS
ncbi:bifunctional copper resistance protein CopD/cytochrome c oxidase assembly protein [Rathayibacter sp. VKM Ac-2856]|uniref:cytochrome c oxidase assembly protein n=1 Tax=unclassified Rathayibacter TaxID=2609250 RepID=UPI001565C955|nr:bifunctional copper resistance protein CopD/cytochrome c oxidase assembly protein [Rathayibacter sp. VKM Ac-2858]NQX20809.1 bifunctional copper resistance protein CopD/cytochrome c oxidase assembly protein [Rathayibacter sp. VKM Ac-2856]